MQRRKANKALKNLRVLCVVFLRVHCACLPVGRVYFLPQRAQSFAWRTQRFSVVIAKNYERINSRKAQSKLRRQEELCDLAPWRLCVK